MKKSTLLWALAAALMWTGCSKSDPDEPFITPPDPEDPYIAFKADATPRWEQGSAVQKNEDGAYIYLADNGENLFESPRCKTGRMSPDGSSYVFIEFSGTPVVGTPSGATIRTQTGITTPHSLEIVKVEGGQLWIVYKETASSAEQRVVQ